MARKNGVVWPKEESAPPDEGVFRPDWDDARLVDLDSDDESPFLRGQKRVPVRRGSLPKKTANRLKWVVLALLILSLGAALAAWVYRYGERSWRFRVQSSDDIEIAGTHNVTRRQVLEVMGGDIGRNLFFVPLEQRKTQLEQIPWVESAAVMRFVPNRLKVDLRERTPVAFVRIGPRISLVDAGGHVMELPGSGKQKYSFPVIVGVGESEPLSTRAPRMQIYTALVQDLDSGGTRYSQDLSEADLSDPDDVKVLVSDAAGEVLVHLGSSNFLDRYKIYVAHVQEWRQQFEKLESVDLRYDHQIIVNPDLRGFAKPPALSMTAAKKAMAAGVKPAALIHHDIPVARLPAPAPPKAAPSKAGPRKPAAKATSATKPVQHPAAKKAAAPPAKKRVAPHAKQKPHGARKNTPPPAAKTLPAGQPGKKPSPSIAAGQGNP
jgi:cell division protein FtsQ